MSTDLRTRLVAALRPRMTVVEAQVTADQLLPEVTAYASETAEDALRALIGEQADLVGQVVSAAQDCLDVLGPPPQPVSVKKTRPSLRKADPTK